LEFILDGGQCPVGVESTIIKPEKEFISILRYGGISEEEVESVTGLPVKKISGAEIESPGQLPYHYSPNTRLILKEKIDSSELKEDVGFIFFKNPNFKIDKINSIVLSKDGNLNEVAVNIFAALHKFDDMTFKYILVEKVPMQGIGKAIMDRIEKASKKFSN